MSAALRAWRIYRREFWLWLASAANFRALRLCEMPEDRETVRRIRDAAAVWLP